MRIVLVAALVLVSSSALAQNCQRIGNQTLCDNGVSSSQIGNSTFYNYPDERRAKQQGLPSSSSQIGNTRIYDNGASATDAGNTRFFSDGTTRQRIGNTDFYSNGKTCRTIGNTRVCD